MKRKNRKIRLLILSLIAAGLLGWAGYAKLTQKPTNNAQVSDSQKALQEEVSKNAEEANKNFAGTSDNGGVTDTSGQSAPTSNSTASSVSSASGNITLTTPSAGAKLTDGATVAGTAKVSQVQYRIKDNSRGQLATGTLNVVNGKYSGTVSIRPSGTTGTLEIFSFSSGGSEENNVKINVTF